MPAGGGGGSGDGVGRDNEDLVFNGDRVSVQEGRELQRWMMVRVEQ